jgi:hypothetical protein
VRKRCLFLFKREAEDRSVNLINLIDNLEASIPDPLTGLPEDLFLFVSRITPIINVDLLIKNESDHTLLT